MAQMPRGEPRSVPNPAGEQYDKMIRQERLRKERVQTDLSKPPLSLNEDYFSPSSPRIGTLDLAPRRGSAFRLGKKSYREIDNGRANVLVEVDDPLVSPAQLAERRTGINRARFIADHPLGGLAYGLATLANTSPKTRDTALLAGGLVDTAMLGAAPLGVAPRVRVGLPKAVPVLSPVLRDKVRYGALNAKGQATGASATLTAPLRKGSKSDPNLHPPGLQGDSRGHLLARRLGGSGRIMENLVTQTQVPSNNPQMSGFEGQIAKRVQAGEIIEYSATPLYNEGVLPPASILLTAYGLRGAPVARLIPNPAGRRK